jgi:hypothetical protein
VERSYFGVVVTSADFLQLKGGLLMPILGYCLYVGSALLALLFVTDFYIPKQAPRDETPHTYNIPIAAALVPSQSITFSGQTRDFGAPPPMTVVDFAAKAQTVLPSPCASDARCPPRDQTRAEEGRPPQGCPSAREQLRADPGGMAQPLHILGHGVRATVRLVVSAGPLDGSL